jgi:tetratricopeptide (TPR) repeat protein
MTNKKQVEVKTVPLNTALIIGFIALVIGFFAGNIYDELKSGQGQARIRSGKAAASPDSARMFALERQLETNPNNPGAWLELGNLYFDSNKYQDAIRAYNQYLATNPENPNVWTDLGVMYRRAGNPTQAIASFDKALEINPKHEHARFNKGVVLFYDVGFRDEAFKIWRELSAINPNFRIPDGRTITELIAQENK